MQKRVLAIASAGGHWQQLMLMRSAFKHHDLHFATTLNGLAQEFEANPASTLPDCNRNTPFRIVWCLLVSAVLLLRLRPHVIVSTGALPGIIAIALGRLIGAQTIWVDSVANAEELSFSGKIAVRIAHVTLSQWRAPAMAAGVTYAGSVL